MFIPYKKKIGQSGGGSGWSVCYQWGLPRPQSSWQHCHKPQYRGVVNKIKCKLFQLFISPNICTY